MIDVEIEDEAWTLALPDAADLARRAAEAALEPPPPCGEGAGGRGCPLPSTESAPPPPTPPRKGEGLVILLTDDETVRDLNARFRGKDAPTNVLSFPAPANPEALLGDIALAYGVCAREAADQQKPLAHHLQHLVAHGVLHLVGWDHQSDADADAMEALERRILAGLGVPDPYASEDARAGHA